ncbi:hypothetical protein A3D11_00020 [Candidatus Peribacteria bacterium RIFCSPHIGHO2_02_FULL_49_16]|nr:MAG: hypothetical protein A2880_00520 [Candidatus Peribacteria bacterium RIFCSPHIGHO2_01_FULL_49_38]OGJ60165.1 MAG: hypothetical protein A3D11_00020 [Candidatus Peribacteria bacterium RIFCSPHIGHO2_02_FULL_49_16]
MIPTMDVPLWQSPAWKHYQEALGREIRIYENDDTFAQVVIDRTVGGWSAWDIPRGPIGNNREHLLEKIIADAKQDKCFSFFLSPIKPISPITPLRPALSCHLIPTTRHEQPEATRIIDLTCSESELLAQMKPKGRYNIGVAEKHGIIVKESNDIDAFYSLLQQTGGRDGFRIKPKREYEIFLEKLEGSFLLIAHANEQPVAGLMGVIWNTTGYYYYGASSYEYRNLMASYLLQWEAMQYCKREGCNKYDLLGIAPPGGANHPWSGVSQFKEKFGGEVITYPPEQEIVFRPILKKLVGLKRKFF